MQKNITLASRTRIISDGFNGFLDYIFDSPQGANIHKLLNSKPNVILYGEWLVPHTIQYKEENYKRWYLYDIFDIETETFIFPDTVRHIALAFDIYHPRCFGTFTNPTKEYLEQFVGQSSLGAKGEGIVLKNHEFVNKFGNRCYAKMVRQGFLEDSALKFNGNDKHQEFYTETYIINKWLRKARIEKILNKLQTEINESFDLKHIPRIVNTAYYDLIAEEAWEIAKLNKVINFNKLKDLAVKKAKLLYLEILNGG